MKDTYKILKNLGYNIEETKHTDVFFLRDGDIKYRVLIFNTSIAFMPEEFRTKPLNSVWWKKMFSINIPDIENEIKNYIASTTNDIFWTYERASELVWRINLQSSKMKCVIKSMIDFELPY